MDARVNYRAGVVGPTSQPTYSATTAQPIITPEAVVLDFERAGVASRTLAFAIDMLALGATLVGLLLAAVAAGASAEGVGGALIALLTSLLTVVVWFTAFETLWRGRTLGKAALGLRAVSVDGTTLRFQQAFLRAAVGLVDFFLIPIGFIAVVTALVSPRDQRLGDMAAGTFVVRERTAARSKQVVPAWFAPPYGYERYAASLDVSALDEDVYALIRTYLLRMAELTPAARDHLAIRLANPVAVRMGHTPPQWLYPHAFLACVAAAWQRAHGGPAPPLPPVQPAAMAIQAPGYYGQPAPAYPPVQPAPGHPQAYPPAAYPPAAPTYPPAAPTYPPAAPTYPPAAAPARRVPGFPPAAAPAPGHPPAAPPSAAPPPARPRSNRLRHRRRPRPRRRRSRWARARPPPARPIMVSRPRGRRRRPGGPRRPRRGRSVSRSGCETWAVPEPPLTYLDHAATTPLRPAARDAMVPWLGERFGNPSGAHRVARAARAAIDDVRDVVAAAVGCRPGDVVFTSGGTEADNLAVLGVAGARPGPVLAGAVEHDAVLAPLARVGGRTVPVDRLGVVDPDALAERVSADTTLVSIMVANNEIGVVQPTAALAGIVARRAPSAVVHADAVQAAAWLALPERLAGVHLVSLSSHKVGGPQGVGALVVRPGTPLAAVALGGGQERELRTGTHDVAGIVGFGAALAAALAERDAAAARVAALRDRLAAGLRAAIPGLVETGEPAERLPGTLHVCVPGVESEALLFLLDEAGVCASAASACASGAHERSHVLAAMGVPDGLAAGALRLSLGWSSTAADVDRALAVVPAAVARLREAVA